jgi:carboxyl-terminal processing protease
MFYRVNGDSTQINGVAADIVLPSRFEGLDYKEADLDNPLPWDQIAAARYKARPLGIDLDAMRKASDARIRDHREFSYLRADIARRAKLQAETGISLDLATRRAEIDEVKAEQDDREAQRKAAGWDGESPLDPILDEAVEIARDYVGQLGG